MPICLGIDFQRQYSENDLSMYSYYICRCIVVVSYNLFLTRRDLMLCVAGSYICNIHILLNFNYAYNIQSYLYYHLNSI